MVEVACRGAPGIVEIVQALHAEAARGLLRHSSLQPQIFPRNIFKLHIAAAANIESDWTVSARVVFRNPAPRLATPIQEIANDIGVQIDLDIVPVGGSKR